jgi:uncharacterized 2Fe-2S/4Fe-4S cluster protein (DUF4445 family)
MTPTSQEVRILFTPSGRQGTVTRGSSVLDAARSLGVDLDSICGGRGICGRCQVRQGSSKTVPLDATQLSSPGATEAEYRGRRPLWPGNRLGCATAVLGDVVIDVPPESQIHRPVVRKRPEAMDYEIDPVVRLYYVETEPPTLGSAMADDRRILDALADQWSLTEVRIDPRALTDAQQALDAGVAEVTVAVHDGDTITGIWAGFRDRVLGVAFDVGSTTVAGHLCDLTTGALLAADGVMNPQIRFGEDVMSRVSYAMLNDDGAAALTTAVRDAINALVVGLTQEAGATPADVLEVTIVGNPIMHHLVLGLDPAPLGVAPFAPVTASAVRVDAASIGIDVHPLARVYVLPCVAGHVGADTAAAMLSERPDARPAIQLLVDIGTNAEIVLGNESRVLAASSPTGPALEGAQISSGQRAAPGAVERVAIDRETLEPRIRIVGSDIWSDDPGFAGVIEQTPLTGICGSGIIDAIAELFLAGVISADGVIDGGAPTPRVVRRDRTYEYVVWEGPPRISITQEDVRAVQLAKAALQAGARLLMDRFPTDTVDEIRLAGAFGNHIDPRNAMVLGLVPDCDIERVTAAGNAAGTGAIMALLSAGERDEVERMVASVEKVETATEPRFQEHFVASLAIPHATADYPRLQKVVSLPERTNPGARRRVRGTRRRTVVNDG